MRSLRNRKNYLMKNPKKKKNRVLYATNNKGKLKEASVFAASKNIELISLNDLGIKLDVDETGRTYKENALLKANAFAEAANDPTLIVIADDSGIEIPVLNNEPGIHSRRWKGYTMSDKEIIDYTLERLKDFKRTQRNANFVAVLAILQNGQEPHYITESMRCEIMEEPVDATVIEGFPFRSLMYIPELDKMIYEIHGTTIESRGGFMTHREKALAKAFEFIASQ